MSDFRSIKLNARRDLHRMMRVPAYVFSQAATMPRLVHVRLHRKEGALGDLKGTSFGFSKRREEEPSIVFEVAEYSGNRLDIVAVTPTEMYRLDNDEPVYNITKTWYAVALTEEQRELYASPEQRLYAVCDVDGPGFDFSSEAVSGGA